MRYKNKIHENKRQFQLAMAMTTGTLAQTSLTQRQQHQNIEYPYKTEQRTIELRIGDSAKEY